MNFMPQSHDIPGCLMRSPATGLHDALTSPCHSPCGIIIGLWLDGPHASSLPFYFPKPSTEPGIWRHSMQNSTHTFEAWAVGQVVGLGRGRRLLPSRSHQSSLGDKRGFSTQGKWKPLVKLNLDLCLQFPLRRRLSSWSYYAREQVGCEKANRNSLEVMF